MDRKSHFNGEKGRKQEQIQTATVTAAAKGEDLSKFLPEFPITAKWLARSSSTHLPFHSISFYCTYYYVCVYVYVHVCTYMYVCSYAHTCTCLGVRDIVEDKAGKLFYSSSKGNTFICVCLCVYMWVCTCVHVYSEARREPWIPWS